MRIKRASLSYFSCVLYEDTKKTDKYILVGLGYLRKSLFLCMIIKEERIMSGVNSAILSHRGELTSFKYAGENIRFRTSPALRCYTSVKQWDNGYLVSWLIMRL